MIWLSIGKGNSFGKETLLVNPGDQQLLFKQNTILPANLPVLFILDFATLLLRWQFEKAV